MKVMTYQDYIWDLGGTLLDNYELSTQAFCRTMAAFHLAGASHDAVYMALKGSTEEAVTRFASGVPGFLEAYRKREALDLERPILFKGAEQVLARVVSAGGRNFLWSHRDRQVLTILDRAGIARYFTEVITSDNGFPRKPNPAALLFLKEKYNITNGLVIGDREIDQQAGYLAGFPAYLFDGSSPLASIFELE